MPEDFYDADSEKEENVTTAKKGRPRKFKPVEEFFIELCRLRGGFSERHLAHLYGVAQSTISRLLVPWINFMYLKFGQVCIWPSKSVVQATMPADFKEKFPSTRVIIDFTEVFCEMPSSLLLNSELFSSFKNQVDIERTCWYCTKWGHYICHSTLHRQHFWPWNHSTEWNFVPILWWWRLCDGRQGISDSKHPTPWCRSEHPTILRQWCPNVCRGCC